MKTVLITGGTGFVGANLARRLVHDGYNVHLLVRPGYNNWRLDDIATDIQYHIVDLSDYSQVLNEVKQISPEWVFHLAAHGAYSWQNDFPQILETNVNGTVNLLEACCMVDFEAFINAGSSSEYGFKEFAPDEREWLDPNSYYAVTKAFASQHCRYTAISRNLNIITLRLYSVFGPYEQPARLMPTLIRNALEKKLPPLVDPTIARDYIYIDDVLAAFLRASSQKGVARGAVYNVGTGRQTSLAAVVESVTELLNVDCKPEWGTFGNRLWDTDNWVANIERSKKELNWQPLIILKTGIGKFVNWFIENPDIMSYYEANEDKTHKY